MSSQPSKTTVTLLGTYTDDGAGGVRPAPPTNNVTYKDLPLPDGYVVPSAKVNRTLILATVIPCGVFLLAALAFWRFSFWYRKDTARKIQAMRGAPSGVSQAPRQPPGPVVAEGLIVHGTFTPSLRSTATFSMPRGFNFNANDVKVAYFFPIPRKLWSRVWAKTPFQKPGVAIHFDRAAHGELFQSDILAYSTHGSDARLLSFAEESFVSRDGIPLAINGRNTEVRYRLSPVTGAAAAQGTSSAAPLRQRTHLLGTVANVLARGPVSFTLSAELVSSGGVDASSWDIGTIEWRNIPGRAPGLSTRTYFLFGKSILSEGGEWGLTDAEGRGLTWGPVEL